MRSFHDRLLSCDIRQCDWIARVAHSDSFSDLGGCLQIGASGREADRKGGTPESAASNFTLGERAVRRELLN
jgi:hypothetical protein